MTLRLYYHPFASFCQKVLIALYEGEIAFTPHLVDLADPEARAAFAAVWPPARFPVLRDEARGRTVPESTIIIEYLAAMHPGRGSMVPADPEEALATRQWDRIFDHYVELPMQKIVTDRLRPAGKGDPAGVEEARGLLKVAYGLIEGQVAGRRWAAGEEFGMADCAAAPALFYANVVAPFGADHPALAAYLGRLLARPSVARVVEEARPWRRVFPLAPGETFGP
jgi:glutathione S-transferase